MPDNDTNPPARLDWPIEAVARITLTRGDQHNTLTTDLLAEFERLLQAASVEGARALLVTGSGKSFCGGAHIRYFTDADSPLHRNPRAIRHDYVQSILRVLGKLRHAPFATIAVINGFALGGGCELALSCDFRLMAEGTRIGLPEVGLGAVPGGGGVQMLARLVGRSRALEIALLGEQLSASEAKAAGLVGAVHPPAQLEEAAITIARRILVCSPISIAETKRALYRCETATAEEADRIALDAVAAAAAGSEWWEGMAAFVEKRPASFQMEG